MVEYLRLSKFHLHPRTFRLAPLSSTVGDAIPLIDMGSTSGPNVRLSCHEYGSWYPLKCRLAVGNAPPLQYIYEFVSPSRVQRRHVLELWRYLYRYTAPSSRVTRMRGNIPRIRGMGELGDMHLAVTILSFVGYSHISGSGAGMGARGHVSCLVV